MCAVWFIALILLPFTAPFPTYQLDPAHRSPCDAAIKEFKAKITSDDGPILLSNLRSGVPTLEHSGVSAAVHDSQFFDLPVHHLVLRL
jgi:hypothetical protein